MMEEYLYIASTVVAVLIVVVLMYAGSVYVMREKSFESALVEQSDIRRELLEQTSNKHEKKVRRQQVRGKQVEKTQTECTNEVVVASETYGSHSPASKKRVELDLEPKIMTMLEENEDANTRENKPSSPSKPAKSILLNKDEKGQVSASIAIPELFHRHISVDELDLKTERRKSDTVPPLSLIEAAAVTPVTETRLKTSKKKKSKVEVVEESADSIKCPSLEEEISETFSSLTVLGLNKAPEDHVNNEERNEDKRVAQLLLKIEELKRLLNDKEKSIISEKSQLASSKAQISDQQKEIAAIKQRNDELVKQKHIFEAEAEKAASSELFKVNEKHSRAMNELQSTVVVVRAELDKLRQSNQKLSDENRLLKDANQRHIELAQKTAVLEDALKKSSITLASNENVKQHLEIKLRQYEEKLSQLTSHLNDVSSENHELLSEIQKFNVVKDQINSKHCSELKHLDNSFKECELQKTMFENQVVVLQSRLVEVEHELLKSASIQDFRNESRAHNETFQNQQSSNLTSDIKLELESELVEKINEIQSLQQLLNEQKKKNEGLRQKNVVVLNALNEMEKLAQNSITLKDECERKTNELNRLQAEVKDLKQKQKILRDGSNTTGNLKKIKPDATKGSNQKHVISNGTTSNACTHPASTSLSPQNSNSLNELTGLQNMLAVQKEKNDELRKKNCMVLEALAKVEKLAASSVHLKDQLALKDEEIKRLTIEAAKLKDDKTLKDADAYMPSVDDHSGRKEVTFVTHVQETASWDMSQLVLDLDTKTAELQILQSLLEQNDNDLLALQQEKDEVKNLVRDLQSQIKQKDSIIKNLSKSNSKVPESNSDASGHDTDLVQHYKKVLRETEAMLSSLQASVEKEENSWRSKVTTVENELEKERKRSKLLDEKLAVVGAKTYAV